MKTWLKQFRQDPAFIHSPRALQSLYLASWPERQKTGVIASALMMRYAHPNCPPADRSKLIQLMIIAAQRGLDSQANCNGAPFHMLAHRYRLHDVVRQLQLPDTPTLQNEVFLKGYLGVLVKMGINSLTKNQKTDTLLNQRNSPYQMQPVLKTLRKIRGPKSKESISFRNVVAAIHRNGLQPRPADIKYIYRIKPGKTLPMIQQHLLHAAVSSYNLPLLKKLINMGVNIAVRDYFGRNILHLAHIIDSAEILAFLNTLPEKTKQKLSVTKDGFGKTPMQVAKWKQVKRRVEMTLADTVNGGWNPTRIATLETDRMDIDQIHVKHINRNRFLSDHVSVLKPVLIKQALSPNHELTGHCRKEAFLNRFGQTQVATGAIPYASTFQQPESRGPLKDMQTGWNKYIFSPLSPEKDKALISMFNCLDITNKLDNLNWQFYHGPAESGAPIHFHGDAWNLLVHGKKRWFIYPPMAGYYSTKPIRDWLNTPHPPALEFTQNAGDLVYIPRYWAHGVVNVQESIGIATEFNSPYVV